MMTSRERVLSALCYGGYDRLPVFYKATPELDQALREHLGIAEPAGLEQALGLDLRTVEALYIGPELRTFPDGSWEGLWGERYANVQHGSGAYPEAMHLPYSGVTRVEELAAFRLPSPAWYDYSGLKAQCERLADYARVYGGAGIPDFINGIARCRGVEQVLLDIALREPVYLKLIEQRHEFLYGQLERGLQAAGGLIDILALGEDYGSQRGLLISPRTFDQLFRPFMQDLGYIAWFFL